MRFKNAMHRRNFTGYISPKNSNYYSSRSEFVAAVFLLSADKLLWERSECAFARYAVNFDLIDLNGISTDGYALYKAARTVYNGSADVLLSELCDWTLIDDPTMLTIFSGVMLVRNGIRMLHGRA
ncbi:MAG: hypothetical protein NC299_16915 [Lachnospiraceae bacterium]|nr:hypothetical protein [Ruminococcus sp.]MCM1277013.1 hypothetical protein [Lachnospiraceae bacterium]